METNRMYRSRLKNRILVQYQGGAKLQPAGILKYSEELKRRPNTEIELKDIFEMASKNREGSNAVGHFYYPVLRRMLVPILPFV
jgi:hypothetical protein